MRCTCRSRQAKLHRQIWMPSRFFMQARLSLFLVTVVQECGLKLCGKGHAGSVGFFVESTLACHQTVRRERAAKLYLLEKDAKKRRGSGSTASKRRTLRGFYFSGRHRRITKIHSLMACGPFKFVRLHCYQRSPKDRSRMPGFPAGQTCCH